MKECVAMMMVPALSKLFNSLTQKLADENYMSTTEMSMLMFLHANPLKDTANEIARCRRLTKSAISLGVETLSSKGYLIRRVDEKDRRVVHLSISNKAQPIEECIDREVNALLEELFSGFSEIERREYYSYAYRILENAEKMLNDTE